MARASSGQHNATVQDALNELCMAAAKRTKEIGEALEYFRSYCTSNQSAVTVEQVK
jgi:hypothetical protein